MTSVAMPPKTGAAAPRPVTPPASSAAKLDEAVARTREGAGRLLRLSLDDRVALARVMQAGYLAVARDSVHAACAAKGIRLGTPLEGEEWTAGPWMVVRHLRLIQQALLALKHAGNTPVGERGRTADGRLTVQVFPGRLDRRHPLQGRTGGRPPPGRCHRPGPGRHSRALLQGAGARRPRRARARRRQRERHPLDGRHHQAVQRGQGLRPQDEPGERLPRPLSRARLRRRHPSGLPLGGLRRRGGGRVSGRPRRRGRDPHHRLRPHVRSDHVGRARTRAGRAEARRPSGHLEADHRRAWRRRSGARGAGPLLGQGARVSGRGRGQRADLQRLVRLQREPRRGAAPRLVAPGAVPRPRSARRLERAVDRQAYYPGRPRAGGALRRRPRLADRRQGRRQPALEAGRRRSTPAPRPSRCSAKSPLLP